MKVRVFLIIGLVIFVSALAVGGFTRLVYRGTAEARVLSSCVRVPASAREVAYLDLTSLGLRPTGIPDPHATYGEGFVDGAVVEYGSEGNVVALVAALQYADPSQAAMTFSGFQDWAQANCGRSLWATFGAQGVIHCDFSDGHDMILLSDQWIVDIETTDFHGVAAAQLADQIRDAVAAHWQRLREPSAAVGAAA